MSEPIWTAKGDVESLGKSLASAMSSSSFSSERDRKPPGLSSEGIKEWDRVGFLCPVHLGEVVSYFCDDCGKSCCTICAMLDHYMHKKQYARSEGIEDGLFGHTGIFFPSEFTIEGLLKKVNDDLQHIDLKSPDAKEKIKACVSLHKGVLETKKRTLIDHVNAVKKAKLKYLQEQQKHLRKTLDELNGSVSYAKRFLDSEDHFSLLSAEKEITRRLAELNEKCSKIALPTERDWNLDKIKVIRDGKYVRVNRSRRPPTPPKPGMKTVHDAAFKATSVKLSLSVEPETFQAIVRTCCQELGEKYWLRVR